MTADLPGGFDDLGDAAVGRPEHPAVQFGPGLVAGRLGGVFCFNVCSTGSAVFFRSVG